MSVPRVRLITLLFLCAIVVLLGRSLFLTLQGDPISSIPISRVQIYPSRGLILDNSGIPLVENHRRYFYYFDCGFFRTLIDQKRVNVDEVIEQIVAVFSMDRMLFLEQYPRSSFILLGVFDQEIRGIERPLSLFVSLDQRSARTVLYPELAQIIGRVDTYGAGLSGIELQMDSILSPNSIGLVDYERMGSYQRYGRITDIQPSTDGEDIHLSISLVLQQILAERIEEAKLQYQAKEASGLIIETSTGKVRALYSTMGWNSLIMNIYEIGSAIKPLFFGMAMKYGVLDFEKEYRCTGKIQPFPDLHYTISDTYAHGVLGVTEGLAHSCNVVTIEIAKLLMEELGDWTIFHELQRMGFGSKTGIELPGEVVGILHRPNDWNRLTGVQMSIGYGLAMTQLQLVMAINAIANDGMYISPTVLEQRINPIQERLVFQPTVNKILTDMMVEVVESGTGKLAKIRGLPIAGKTGTATKPLPGGGGYSSDRFMSSFIGFFPADDPVYTILVSLDEPQGSLYYSSDIAAPVFQKIVYDVIDALKDPDHQSPEPLIYRSWNMPSFIGLTVKDVLDLCSDLGIDLSKISVVGSGLVKQQYPAPETPIEWVDEVIVHLGK